MSPLDTPALAQAQHDLERQSLDAALAQIEPLATLLVAGQNLPGVDDPRSIELTCYQVLVEAGEARAEPVLQVAHRNLQAAAASLDDGGRQSFLHNIPFHRAINAAWNRRPAP